MAETLLRRLLDRLRGREEPPGARTISYAPRHNREADPGEVVWAEVAFEDQPDVVKDRPLLVVGRKDRTTVLCLQLSTQQKRDGQDGWLPLGAGAWDRLSRPSFVRLDRVIELRADAIRRQGAVLDPARFTYVADALRARGEWR